MRRAVVSFLLLSGVALGAAVPARAAAFEGRLLLADGRPAAGFVVSVVGGTLSVPCAADGSFVLDPAPSPPFHLVAAGPNGSLSAPIEIAEPGAGVVELRLAPVLRDSVTVVSGVAPGLDLLPASAATRVTAEALEQRPPQRLVDALEAVAGASKLGEGADSVPALRGLARGRTLILIDGARVSAERRAGPSATFLDPDDLSAVEILRGPGSVVYGSDAFGGVLHAVTRDPEPETPLRLHVEAVDGGQNELGASASGSFRLGRASVLARLSAVDADDTESGGGSTIGNSSFGSTGGAVRAIVPTARGLARAAIEVDRVDDLGKAAIDSDAIRSVYPREDSDRLTVSWIGAAGSTWDAIEAIGFLGRYRIVLDRDRAPTGSSNRRIDRSDTDARDGSLRLVAGRAWGGGRLQLGADATSRFDLEARVGRVQYAADATTVVAVSDVPAIEDARQVTTALFATWAKALAPEWSFAAGLRGDRVESDNRGGFFGDRSTSASEISGNLALTWSPAPGWSGTVQAARGFRVPTLSDRFFRGPSGRGFVTGNPDLEPERGTQLDLAVRRTLGRANLAVYAYRYEIDDLVERYREGDDFRFRNRGAATFEGLELEVQARLDDAWTVEGGGAWTRGRADGDPVDDQPAPRLFAGTRFAAAWGYVFGRVEWRDRKDDPGPTELERAGVTLLDVGAGWRFREGFELRAVARNLTDELYTGAADEDATASPGRSLAIALSVEL